MSNNENRKNIFNKKMSDALGELGYKALIENIPSIDFVNEGYEKLEVDSYPFVSSTLQQLPHILDTAKRKSEVECCVRLVRDGKAVKVSQLQKAANFDPLNPLYRANIVDGVSNNNIVGQAALSPMALSLAPVVVSSVFAIAAAATGQYYLNKINTSIDDVKESVNSVLQFVESDKKSKLRSRIKYMEYIQRNINSIATNVSLKTTVLSELQSIKIDAYADYSFYGDQITKETEKLKSKENKEAVSESLGDICAWISLMYNAMSLYVFSIYLETLLYENLDSDYYQNVKKEIEGTITHYSESVEEFNSTIDSSLDESSAYAYNETISGIAQIALLPALPLIFPIAVAAKAIINDEKKAAISDLEKHKENKKKELSDFLVGYLKNVSNTLSLESLMRNIDFLDKYNNGKMEIICLPGATYLKLE